MGTKYFKVTANERVTLEDAQIVSELEAEVAELQAQLARCVDALTEMQRNGYKQGWDFNYGNSMLKTSKALELLPAIASKDAEILRCASELYSHSQGLVEQGFYIAPLFEAVRARNEAENNENIS